MKKIGIIGGIAPESTIAYYREIINSYQHKVTDGSYPQIIINSINMTKMLSFISDKNLTGLVNYLLWEIDRLKCAGADFGILASNTPHIVFNEINKLTSIPLISIVESVCKKAKSMGLKKVGLFGTKSTMQGNFYPDVFAKESINIIVPEEKDQDYIHNKYFSELVKGIFHDETKQSLLAIINKMKNVENIDAVILGGTELPLILKEKDSRDVPLLDTTKIHVDAVIEELFKNK